MREKLEKIISNSSSRTKLWEKIINESNLAKVAEIGVYRGEFAEIILRSCSSISKYYMVDPWRFISDWNKPANKSNAIFNKYYREALDRTKFAEAKRIILRGKTNEVAENLPDKTLDFIYIDGDHTLKGITIDLKIAWEKVHNEGFIGGDDFCPNIWQHEKNFEPTLIFPYAIYFAEAMNVKIFALPFNQFLISKKCTGFEFINLSGKDYLEMSLLKQMETNKSPKKANILAKFFKKIENAIF